MVLSPFPEITPCRVRVWEENRLVINCLGDPYNDFIDPRRADSRGLKIFARFGTEYLEAVQEQYTVANCH